MPRYDFKCKDCEHVFEIQCKIAELNDTHECPSCTSSRVEQTYVVPAFHGDSIALGLNQHQRAFKEVLNKIHTRTAGSVMNHTTNM